MQIFQQRQNELSKPATHLGGCFIQPQLKIGRSDDKHEQEADRVADYVMRSSSVEPIRMQTQEEEEELQMKCENCEEDELQMKPELQFKNGTSFEASPDVSNKIRSTKGTGSALTPALQHEMSSKIGADFSGVNIHTGSDAAQMNKELGARAFTQGSDIYFNRGEYNPETSSGKRLLAHELTHVLQQESGVTEKSVQRDGPENTETDLATRLGELIPNTSASSSQGPVEPEVTARARAFLDTARIILDDVHRDVNTLLNLMSGMNDFVSEDEVHRAIGLMILYESLDALAVAVPEGAEAAVTVIAKTIKVLIMANEVNRQATAANRSALSRAMETVGLFDLLVEAQTSVDELSNRVQFEPDLAEFLAQQPIPVVPRRVATQISREIEFNLIVSYLKRSGNPIETEETETVVLPRSGNPMDTDMNRRARERHEDPLDNFWLRRLRIRAEWSTISFSPTGNMEYSWYYWKIRGSRAMVSFFLNRLDRNGINKDRFFEALLGHMVNYR